MKVLKKSVNPWSMKIKCSGKGNGEGGCWSVLEIEIDDIFRTFSNHYDGSSETYLTIKCPVCGILTDLDKNKFPLRDYPDQKTWLERQNRIEK